MRRADGYAGGHQGFGKLLREELGQGGGGGDGVDGNVGEGKGGTEGADETD